MDSNAEHQDPHLDGAHENNDAFDQVSEELSQVVHALRELGFNAFNEHAMPIIEIYDDPKAPKQDLIAVDLRMHEAAKQLIRLMNTFNSETRPALWVEEDEIDGKPVVKILSSLSVVMEHGHADPMTIREVKTELGLLAKFLGSTKKENLARSKTLAVARAIGRVLDL